VLRPSERIAEVLFSLIMVPTLTSSLRVATAGADDVHTVLMGALGCNLVWGIIDAVLYLMGRMAEKGRALMVLQAVRKTAEPPHAHRLIVGALPAAVACAIR